MQAFVIATLAIASTLEEDFDGPDDPDVVSLVEIKSFVFILLISSAFILFVYIIL